MKKLFLYTGVLILLLAMAGCGRQSAVPVLRETYAYDDTNPFGGSVAYSLMRHIYPEYLINIKKDGFAKTVGWFNDKSSLYVCISRNFFPGDEDEKALLDFVADGNTVFIAASVIDSAFLDMMSCRMADAEIMKMLAPKIYRQTSVRLIEGARTEKQDFKYYYLPFAGLFSDIDSSITRKVGYNQNDEPNCIVVFWGKGRLFLHCEPRALSNYFLLTGSNHLYFKQLLQLMPRQPENIYWDDHYRRSTFAGPKRTSFSLAAIFENPSLGWAFLLGLLLLLLYIFFSGKRRQRIVPVIKPVQNSSIRFAQSIAGLYLNGKDNKDIAEKMITYFSEHIRTHYFLSTHTVNDSFMDMLSRKSGMPPEKTKALYASIAQVNAAGKVDDKLLLQLNEQIQEFYKTKI
ncbi:MAG: hypothetical protein WAT19_05010 [Ferruginibacter sp.]